MAIKLKIYHAEVYDRINSQFYNFNVAATSYDSAKEIADEWAKGKYHSRVKKITIESSKGEIIAHGESTNEEATKGKEKITERQGIKG